MHLLLKRQDGKGSKILRNPGVCLGRDPLEALRRALPAARWSDFLAAVTCPQDWLQGKVLMVFTCLTQPEGHSGVELIVGWNAATFRLARFQSLRDYNVTRWPAKAQNLHPKTVAPNHPACQKQQKLKTYIPKRWLSKSSNMRKTAKAQNLHPKSLAFQIFQHAKNSTSSKPTSQNVGFPNLPACQQQPKLKIYIPKRWLSKFSYVRRTAKAEIYIPKRWLSKSCNMPKTATAQNLQLSKSSNMQKTAKA